MRKNSIYIRVYILWMNLFVQIIIPFLLLIVLNYRTYNKIKGFEKRSRGSDASQAQLRVSFAKNRFVDSNNIDSSWNRTQSRRMSLQTFTTFTPNEPRNYDSSTVHANANSKLNSGCKDISLRQQASTKYKNASTSSENGGKNSILNVRQRQMVIKAMKPLPESTSLTANGPNCGNTSYKEQSKYTSTINECEVLRKQSGRKRCKSIPRSPNCGNISPKEQSKYLSTINECEVLRKQGGRKRCQSIPRTMTMDAGNGSGGENRINRLSNIPETESNISVKELSTSKHLSKSESQTTSFTSRNDSLYEVRRFEKFSNAVSIRKREVVLAKISLYIVFVMLLCHGVRLIPNMYEMIQTYTQVSKLYIPIHNKKRHLVCRFKVEIIIKILI